MDMTLREVLDRYGPTLALIAAIVILVAVFPSSRSEPGGSVLTAGAQQAETGAQAAAGPTTGSGTTSSGARQAGGVSGGPVSSGSGQIATGASPEAFGPKVCRPDGRMPGISRIMPPCLGVYKGNNGGATAKGVTGDSITIVRYMGRQSAATEAALRGAGAEDSRETKDRVDQALVDYFKWHYESYGRAIKVITMEATGEPADDAAARADARTIAEKHKAFATWQAQGASDTFVEEVADRGVICICTTSLSVRFYAEHRDRVFSSLPTAEEMRSAIAEYIGKRLKGQPAKHAGAGSVGLPRKYGLVYLEATSAGPRKYAKEVRDFFVAEMKKYGVPVTKSVGYSSDLSQAQEQTTNVIAQLQDAGVTTVVLTADPLFPIFLTKESTRQGYFPEWLIVGTALTDTTFFGRTYDPPQWQHAFGISPLWVQALDVATSGGYREYHHARPGSNRGDEGVQINVRRAPIQWILQGIQMAGPNLTADSFAQGMYNFPRSGGEPHTPLIFFTREHPTAIKDYTEVWWNPQGSGRDETGKDGPGTMMKVDGGRRWLIGTWPRTEPKVFVMEGAVYAKDYPQPEHEQDGHKHDPKKGCRSC